MSGLDLRYGQTDPAKYGVWKAPVAAGHGSGGRGYDIVPGKPNESILLYRVESKGSKHSDAQRRTQHGANGSRGITSRLDRGDARELIKKITCMSVSTAEATSDDFAIESALRQGAERLSRMSLDERRVLIDGCLVAVQQNWESWVQAAWEAKRIPSESNARAEDILTGVVPTLRYLHLLRQTLNEIDAYGEPRLPGKPRRVNGRMQVPVFPTRSLFDRLLFGPISGVVQMQAEASADALFGDNLQKVQGTADSTPQVCLVLGAGNVSSIPITDALTKIFQENYAVLLKMNPVNEYLGPIFEKVFAGLVRANILRIVYGGGEVGAKWIASSAVDSIHITGSDKTHDAIVWGATTEEQARRKAERNPLHGKPVTSELGNVSPWIVVPGSYSDRALLFQAENIAASITNNASFNCVATKMLITAKDWKQREKFLDLLEEVLAREAPRFAYYSGAIDRFERFAGRPAESEFLPWVCRRGVSPTSAPELFEQESFVRFSGDLSERRIFYGVLANGCGFCERSVVGDTLCWAYPTGGFSSSASTRLWRCHHPTSVRSCRRKPMPGVAFGLMSMPWGGYPGATMLDVQSGVGRVHNTLLLDKTEKQFLNLR